LQATGSLIIVGGGQLPETIRDRFIELAGGPGGRIVIIPTASRKAEPGRLETLASYPYWAPLATNGKVKSVTFLHTRRQQQASDPTFVKPLTEATGVWFSGGDQNRVGDMIVGTPLQKLIQDKYREGAVVGGTSAGAAIMSRIMIEGEDRFGKLNLSEFGPGSYRTREGMAFLPDHVIIDQHFLRRGRQNRLFSLMMEHPGHLGLGVDEATALVVKDGRATVVGKRGVMVFDSAPMTLRGDGFRNLAIHLLRAGESIDLQSRKLQP